MSSGSYPPGPFPLLKPILSPNSRPSEKVSEGISTSISGLLIGTSVVAVETTILTSDFWLGLLGRCGRVISGLMGSSPFLSSIGYTVTAGSSGMAVMMFTR